MGGTGQGFSWLPLTPLVGQSAVYLLWGRNLELCGGKAVGLQTQRHPGPVFTVGVQILARERKLPLFPIFFLEEPPLAGV